ncbi:MAG: lutA 5 [Firmicutes bacterium]|nr:lutA 5 [Bacillota bacterium]
MTAEKCSECGSCTAFCQFLAGLDKTPAMLAKQGIEVDEAFSCSLCGACEAVCPLGLSPKDLFAKRRQEAIRNKEFDIDQYRYLFPDRPNNVMNMYRNYYGIHYDDIENTGNPGTWFFPGCTLLTYSPQLTREVFQRLQADCNCQGIWTACCGKPLAQMGLLQRFETMQAELANFVKKHNISRIITACPGCYYQLKSSFQSSGVAVQTVYEVLRFEPGKRTDKIKCTIHDACPDRFELNFASQVRQALQQSGFSIVEMEHNKKQTICCGSGGQISHFNPELTETLVEQRVQEAQAAGADILAGYCLSCVLKFEVFSSTIPVTHVLHLLLDFPKDFSGAKARVANMFAGANGEKLWEQIMAEDSCEKEIKQGE